MYKSLLAFIVLTFTSACLDPVDCKLPSPMPEEHSNEEIDHNHIVISDISNLYRNEKYSDVVLVVGGNRLHANRDVLAARSSYFSAVNRWIQKNGKHLDRDAKSKVLSAVRCPLMSDEELTKVSESRLISLDTISRAKILRNTGRPHTIGFRAQRKPDVNLAEGSSVTYNDNGGIMIRLSHPSTINYIKIILPKEDLAYYIEVSMGDNDWVKVIDYSDYICRSVQRLWVYPIAAWYIRIVYIRTKNTVNKPCKFEEISYKTNRHHLVEIENEIVAPKYNVISSLKNALIIKGESRYENNTLLDHLDECDMYKRYTWHQLGSGCILIQLPQPYMLSSMRMLLEIDPNELVFFKYTIEVSVNNKEWKMIVNKTKRETQSMQLLNFDPTPIVFIRITGVHCSDGDEFRCVYLEAPAKVKLDSDDDSDDSDETDDPMSGASDYSYSQ
ncbi:BTB/POZ domain-containing protein 9-like isoform X2 [Adelges cooleyi]|uniref:BTB/POZ domain-containing protein 9-like isoform X2 n=1 Tax=Adelges cooleyi TaxID=133065 RepID=UPI0021803D19|nr:BTB/POZ domain-containing protein 9-like isoform X2 [Adelges cooleyi]